MSRGICSTWDMVTGCHRYQSHRLHVWDIDPDLDVFFCIDDYSMEHMGVSENGDYIYI